MDIKDDEFLKRIRETFKLEAEEHVRIFSTGLVDLEKGGSPEGTVALIETLFREIHSLKGAARSVSQKDIEAICYPLENVFSGLKRGEIELSPRLFDILYGTAEILSKMVVSETPGLSNEEKQQQKELQDRLRLYTEEKTGNQVPENKQEIKKQPEKQLSGKTSEDKSVQVISGVSEVPSVQTIRTPVSKLDSLLLQVEEMIQMTKTFDERISELKEINVQVHGLLNLTDRSVQQGYKTSGTDSTYPDEKTKADFKNFENKITGLLLSLVNDKYRLDRMVAGLLRDTRQILVLPVSSFVESFPLMVREMSHRQNKEIDFVTNGTDMEVDKRILEELKDPLIHLLRNSIDHGIEKKDERIHKHKQAKGTLTLDFLPKEGALMEIIVSDDGKGINTDSVIKSAVKTGLITDADVEKMSAQEKLSLIFESGVSTSPIITDISGRGLGLSIVHEKIEKLNGKISVSTNVDKGTVFQILVPMTLSTFRGILVRISEHMFFIPTLNVIQVLKAGPEDIKTVKNQETVKYYDKVISVADPGRIFKLPVRDKQSQIKNKSDTSPEEQTNLLIMNSGDQQIAIKVDEVINEQQILVKDPGTMFRHIENISGVTILGSGKIVPVLNAHDLIKSALKEQTVSSGRVVAEQDEIQEKKILVAEDSVTARTLLKNILESAGYRVTTAFDGLDAFTQIRSDVFDLVVSDVDMPRMNGFELTLKIRNDKKVSDIPIILVTALQSREDRERGIDAGADAYIVKSSFDQGNLLEVIKRLI